MTRTLVTGGSGFLGAHVVDLLLSRGHSVVTTVRSREKADQIKHRYPDAAKEKLDFTIVEDIAQLDAFDKAVISHPPFEAVIHTASPFHYNVTDVKKEMLDPAINGTVGILEAVKKNAPAVKRVVVTSSMAAMLDPDKPAGSVYSEADWDPITEEEALETPGNGYRASKTFAEKAAWDFVEKEKPNFTLAVCNPTLIFGPIIHHLGSLDALNTSNQRVRDLIHGSVKDKCPPTNALFYIDVRDIALAHILAIEKEEAGGKRFFVTGGPFCNKEIVEIIGEEFPELKAKLPTGEALRPGDYPEGGPKYQVDNRRSKEVLGLTYRSLRESIVDTVKSLQAFENK